MAYNPSVSFTRLRNYQNNPVASFVDPIASWLPATWNYSTTYDRIEDENGDSVPFDDLSTVWTTTELDVLDNVYDNYAPDLLLAGIMIDGGSGFYVKTSDLNVVKEAWRILYQNRTFVLKNMVGELALTRCYVSPK